MPLGVLEPNSAAIQSRLMRLQLWLLQLRTGNRRAKMRNMRVRPKIGAALIVGLLLGGAVAAHEISVQEAVAQAQHEADGKVLSVQTLNVGKRKVYRIKVLTRDGQVRVVQVPAEQ